MNVESKLNIPSDFEKEESLPQDPPNSISFSKQTISSISIVMSFPIKNEEAMTYDNEEALITGIHTTLNDNQGIVEVKCGITNQQKKYAYSIIKSQTPDNDLEYMLIMHLDMINETMSIHGSFREAGIIGRRESTIQTRLINEGKLDSTNMQGWAKDPYDANFKVGLLMNMSELPVFDKMFPDHPLSEARRFIKYIIENN